MKTKNTLIIGVVTGLFLFGIILLIIKKKKAMLEKIDEHNLLLKSSNGNYYKIPYTNEIYYNKSQSVLNKKSMDLIYTSFKDDIDLCLSLTGVPIEILLPFIFIESNGVETAKSGASAYGLMQITEKTATNIVARQRIKGLLTQNQKDVLTEILGDRANSVIKSQMSDVIITPTDLYIRKLNLLLGCMFIEQLMKEETQKDGVIRLDRVCIKYNSGAYRVIPTGDTDSLLANPNVPNESKNYIRKMIGQNGAIFSYINN